MRARFPGQNVCALIHGPAIAPAAPRGPAAGKAEEKKNEGEKPVEQPAGKLAYLDY